MAVWESYTQTRQAEDVQDEIYNISPIDNPICSMSKTIRATGKTHEWSQDELVAAGKNAAVEGAAAGADSSQAIVELSNQCQIMTEVAEISGTLETVDKYGRDSEMAYQLELRYGVLANEEELAVAGAPGGTRQIAVVGDASTAREMASFYAQVDAGNIVYATADGLVGGVDITTTQQLEANLLAAHLATYNQGGNPGYLVTDPGTAGFVSTFALSAGRNRDIEDKTLINVIDLYVSTYGQMDVVLDRQMGGQSPNNAMILIDFNYSATPVLRTTHDFPLARLGDSDRREIVRESTYALLNTKAHALVDDIPATLTTA